MKSYPPTARKNNSPLVIIQAYQGGIADRSKKTPCRVALLSLPCAKSPSHHAGPNGPLAAFITEYILPSIQPPIAPPYPIAALYSVPTGLDATKTVNHPPRHAALHSTFSLDLLAPDVPRPSIGVQPVGGIWRHAHASCLCLARHPVEASACQPVHSCNLQRNIALRAGRLRKYGSYEVAFEALHRKLTPFPGEPRRA